MFESQSHLQSHLEDFHGLTCNVFSCLECTDTFTSAKELDRHVFTSHRDISVSMLYEWYTINSTVKCKSINSTSFIVYTGQENKELYS